MVARCNDESILRMTFLEIKRDFHSIVKGEYVAQIRSRVIRVAGIIDLAALAHEEKAFRPVKNLNALCDDFRERRLGTVGIY